MTRSNYFFCVIIIIFNIQLINSQTPATTSDTTEKCVTNGGDTQTWTLNIGTIGTVDSGSVQIEFDLYHSWKEDVTITLTSPTGTVRTIKTGGQGGSDDFGNSDGSGYGAPAKYTIGDGLGGGNLDAGGDIAPGSYDPVQVFSAFDGLTANGNWILTLTDGAAGDDGCIRNVTLSLDVVVPGPNTTLTPTSITGLNYCNGNGPSASQTFTAEGSNLTDDITLTAPVNFEISTDNVTFNSGLVLTQSGGTVNSTTIYTRLQTGLGTATYGPSNLTATSAGATTQNVSLTGEVTANPLTVNAGADQILTIGSTIAFDATVTGCTPVVNTLINEDFGTSGCSGAQNTFPAGWTNVGGDPWEHHSGSIGFGPSSGNGGSGCYAGHDASTNDDEGLLQSPVFDLSGYSSAELKFYIWQSDVPSEGFITLNISIDGGSSFPTEIANYQGITYASWTEVTVDLSAYIGQSSVSLEFEANDITDFDHDPAIDDVLVTGTNTCTYSWTGPNSFTSTDEDPTVTTSATVADIGIYTITATDANGCSQSDQVEVLPANDFDSKIEASATLTEPTTLNSLLDTEPERVPVFDVLLTDLGTSDGVATIIDALSFTQGGNNNIVDWTTAIAGARLNGPDQTDMVGTITATSINFNGTSMISVADGTNETYTLSIWLNSSLTDNSVLDFRLDNSNVTVDNSGSSFGTYNTESESETIEIIATELNYMQDASSACVNLSMSPAITVAAVDANGNIDLDYTSTISINSSGALIGAPVNQSPTDGLATFNSITHSASGTGLSLTASSSGLTSAVSTTFVITDAATLTTTAISNVTGSSAETGGNISNDGGNTVTVRGVAYSTSPNPTIADNSTSDGSGSGLFTSNLSSLSPNTTYYVRAYATNSCGTAYGNEVSFTTLSNLSDISDNGFDEPDNINYSLYNSASGLTTANAIKIGEMIIRDGGSAGTDADTDGTTLTDITFSVSNPSFLQALAIFDGTNNLGEVTSVSASTAFSSLSLVTPDEGTKVFDIYATFSCNVTDNEQIQLTVSSATADTSGSVFEAADAGGTSTSISGDDNRLEVNALVLTVAQQPSNTLQGEIMSPALTIEAVDACGIRDLDYTGSVSISSTGSMTATSPKNAVAGLATFDDIVHSVIENGRTITASGLSSVVTNTFDILVPDNDECVNAFEVLTDGTPTTSLDVTTYTSSGNNLSCDGGTSNEDAYYKFTAPSSGIINIFVDNTNLSGTSINDVEGAVYASCTDVASNTEIACFNFSNSLADSGGQVVNGLTAGVTYFLEVEHYNNDWTGTYDVVIKDAAPVISPNTQECWDLSTATTLFDLGDSGDDYACGFGSEFSGSTDDHVAYLYTPSSNETVDIILENVVSPSDTFAIAIFDNTVGTPVNCIDGTETDTNTTLSNVSLTGGTQYIIIIGSQVNNQNSTGCITISQQCNTTYTLTRPVQNCPGNTYTSRLNFSSLGSIGTTVNVTNGTTSYTNISTGVDYDFIASSTLDQTITITGLDGASMVVCEETVVATSGCNGSDNFSVSAPDITNGCSPGDLSTATVGSATGFTPGCDSGGVSSGDVGNNFIRECPAGFDNNTDWVDLWYQVDLADGTDEMTITVTGLGANEILGYVIHTADPGSDAGSNVATIDGNFECSFFDSTVTSHTITGLADESTAPLYIRILGIAFNDSDCNTIATPTFTICTSSPQPNDICSDALDIDGVSQTGNLCAANIDSESNETDGVVCSESADANDLWYEVTMASGDSDQTLEVDLTFVNATDSVVVELYSNCFSNTRLECATVASTGAGSTVTHAFTSTITEGGFGPTWYVRVVPTTGNSVCDFTILGRRLAENNNCSVMQQPFPGFDVGNTNNDMNFNFATDSGSTPVIAGRDLWYTFDPTTNTDAFGQTTASTSADVVIGGLTGDQRVTAMLYKGNTVSANNCNNLSTDHLETLSNLNNGTLKLTCLDETHTSTDGGYIVRVIQSAGTSVIDNGLIRVDPDGAGPYNNDCENIWNGSGPTNLGWTDPTPGPSDGVNDGGLSVNFNPYVIEEGNVNYLTGSFSNSSDCHPNITSTTCSGSDNTPSNANDNNDMWYVFEIPDSGVCDITTSTIISSINLTYNAGIADNDGVLYIYSSCTDADLIACSGRLDGAGETWNITGLAQGGSYLLRVKPDNSNTNFEYSFDITLEYADPSPCNDDSDDATDLGSSSYISGSNYDSGCTEGNAQGAIDGTVWFQFTAEDNADEAGYVSLYIESLSTGLPNLTVTVYDEVASNSGISPLGSTTTNSSTGDGWIHLGQLTGGEDYFIEISHAESSTTEVNYKLCLYDTPTILLSCPTNGLNITPTAGSQCTQASNCALYYRIDIPANTPSGWYYFEARGNGKNLDIQLFNQGTLNTGTEGNQNDYDQPCNPSRTLHTPAGAQVTIPAGGSCSGGGESAVYNIIGSSTSESLYHYLEVRDADNVFDCGLTAADICSLTVTGPFSTQALAEANATSPDGDCAPLGPCTKPPVLVGATTQSLMGISTMDSDTPWPSGLNNAALAIESKEKGLVITRMVSPETTIGTGSDAIKGMIVYDTDDHCFKMYDGTAWGCITQGCPD